MSWYTTCAITNLPIFDNNPVAYFLLTDQRTENPTDILNRYRSDSGYANSNMVWSPRALPLYANANEYGSIHTETVEQQWNIDFIIENLQKDMIDQEENGRKLAIKREGLNLSLIILAIHSNRLQIKAIGGKQYIGSMMCHRWAYDLLTENARLFWGDDRSLEQAIKDGEEFYEMLQRVTAIDPKNTLYEFCYDKKFNPQNTFKFLNEPSGSEIDGYQLIGIKTYRDLLAHAAIEGKTHNDVFPIIYELACYFNFRQNFQILRKTFAPQSGSGSQSVNLDVHAMLAEASLEHIKKVQEEWAAQDGEDYDEE